MKKVLGLLLLSWFVFSLEAKVEEQANTSSNNNAAPELKSNDRILAKNLLAAQLDSMINSRRFILRANFYLDNSTKARIWIRNDMNYIVVDSNIINVLLTDVSIPERYQFGLIAKGIPNDGTILQFMVKKSQHAGGGYYIRIKYDICGKGYAIELSISPNGDFDGTCAYFHISGKLESLE